MQDSLFGNTKSKQLAELNIRYETEKKDKDLLLQSKNILLLNNQSHGTVTITVDGYSTSWTFEAGDAGTLTIDGEPIHSNQADGSFSVQLDPSGLAASWYFNAGSGGPDEKCDGVSWLSVS